MQCILHSTNSTNYRRPTLNISQNNPLEMPLSLQYQMKETSFYDSTFLFVIIKFPQCACSFFVKVWFTWTNIFWICLITETYYALETHLLECEILIKQIYFLTLFPFRHSYWSISSCNPFNIILINFSKALHVYTLAQ